MKLLPALCCCLLASGAPAFEIDELFDRLDAALTVAAFHAQIRRVRCPADSRRSIYFLDLPSRPTHQFALAVRTNVLHFLRTMCAKGAFVRTNVSLAIH